MFIDMNRLEILTNKTELRSKAEALLNTAKAEARELNQDEMALFTEYRNQMADCDASIAKLDADLAAEKRSLENSKKNNFTKRHTMNSIVKEIRSAMENGSNKFSIDETRAATLGGYTTGEGEETVAHATTAVETEVKPILEPLYEKSVLNEIGATIYNSLPMGEVSVPVMGKKTCGWAGEIAGAGSTQNEFNNVTLRPKRLTAYVDISKALLATDTIGVNAAIERDIVNAIKNKFEGTILSADAKTDDKPAGIFYNASATQVDDFGALCDIEAELDGIALNGPAKYLMNTKVKSYLRQMSKGENVAENVFTKGEVDGTPAVVSGLVPTKQFAYGSFSDFIVGIWGTIDVTVDPYSQAVNGCVRLVVNMYADAVLAREDAVKFGYIA